MDVPRLVALNNTISLLINSACVKSTSIRTTPIKINRVQTKCKESTRRNCHAKHNKMQQRDFSVLAIISAWSD